MSHKQPDIIISMSILTCINYHGWDRVSLRSDPCDSPSMDHHIGSLTVAELLNPLLSV